MKLAVSSPSSLACLYFSRHAIFQPSGLALSLVFYDADVSISGGSLATLWFIRRGWGNASGVRRWARGDAGMGDPGFGALGETGNIGTRAPLLEPIVPSL